MALAGEAGLNAPAMHAGLRPRADRTAIVLSALCLGHCLAFPLLLSLLPWLAWFEAHAPLLHQGLLVLIVPVSGWALIRGRVLHRQNWIVLGGGLAIAALLAAVVLEPVAPHLELPLTLVGSLCLMGFHLANMQALSRCAIAEPGAA